MGHGEGGQKVARRGKETPNDGGSNLAGTSGEGDKTAMRRLPDRVAHGW